MSLIPSIEESQDNFPEAPSGIVINIHDWKNRRQQHQKMLMGMPVLPIWYHPRRKSLIPIGSIMVDSLRHEADKNKIDFIKWLGTKHDAGLQTDLGLSPEQTRNMRDTGQPPRGFDVHHRMPLGGCATPEMMRVANDFSNLVLIRIDHEHKAIHDFLDPQITHHKTPHIVMLPVPIGYWQKPHAFEHTQSADKQEFELFCDYEIKSGTALGFALAAARTAHISLPKRQPDHIYFESSAKILMTAYPSRHRYTSSSPKRTNNQQEKKINHDVVHGKAGYIKSLATEHHNAIVHAFNLSNHEIEDMKNRGKLPSRLCLYAPHPVPQKSPDINDSTTDYSKTHILTTSTIKRELQHQFRKQFRNAKKGTIVHYIQPVFMNPWFSNKEEMPNQEDLKNVIERKSIIYKLSNNDIDVAAIYENFYAIEQNENNNKTPEIIKEKSKKRKKHNPRPRPRILTPYIACQIEIPAPRSTISPPKQQKPTITTASQITPSPPTVKAPENPSPEQRFVRWVATQYGEQMRHDLDLNNADLQLMREKGRLPRHLIVMHQIPLRACGDDTVRDEYDHFDNMVILPTHMQARFSKIIKNQVSGMQPGTQKIIDLPIIPGYWPQKMLPSERDSRGKILLDGYMENMREHNTALYRLMEAVPSYLAPKRTAQPALRLPMP